VLKSYCPVLQASDSVPCVSITGNTLYVSRRAGRFLHALILMSAHCYVGKAGYSSRLSAMNLSTVIRLRDLHKQDIADALLLFSLKTKNKTRII
jgi:hypothetical protein